MSPVLTVGVEIVGWAGTLLILAAYWLLTNGRVSARDASYQWMNVAGAVGLTVNGAVNHAYPSVLLNVIWFAIAATALLRLRTAP